MKTTFATIFLFLLIFSFTSQAQNSFVPSFHVVPPVYTSAPGPSSFTGALATAARTYQHLIHESQLTAIVGKEIKGVTVRLPNSATSNWPAVEVVYANYDFFLSGSVAPVDRSLTFASNVVGTQVQVRSGSLTIPIDAFTFGGSPTNNFGLECTFNTPYLYTGGHLLIEFRHPGFTGTTRSNDGINTTGPGYGTDISACYTGSYTGVSGTAGNFNIIRLTVDDPVPVELTSFTSSVSQNNVQLKWSTATETNNQGFEVERGSNNKWEAVGFVKGAGTTTSEQSYGFIDKNLAMGNYSYRLKQIDFDGTVDFSKEILVDITSPVEFALGQNYPNPFNPSTTIEFSIKERSNVTMTVFNALGEETAVILNETRDAGYHKVNFSTTGLQSGVYFYTIQAGNFTSTKKMIILK